MHTGTLKRLAKASYAVMGSKLFTAAVMQTRNGKLKEKVFEIWKSRDIPEVPWQRENF